MKNILNIVIYNENDFQINKIKNYIKEYDGFHEYSEIVYKDYKQPADILLEKNDVDIYILGICSNDSSSIDVAKRLYARNVNCCIIFLAQTNQYAFEAFQVRAIHYLLKPCSKEMLYEALDRCRYRLSMNSKERILICQVPGGVENISYDDIIYVESQQKYQHIVLPNRTIVLRNSLMSIYEQLRNDDSFIRPHRSFITNMKYIEKINAKGIFVYNNNTIPLPRGTYKKIAKQYLDYCNTLR